MCIFHIGATNKLSILEACSVNLPSNLRTKVESCFSPELPLLPAEWMEDNNIYVAEAKKYILQIGAYSR